MRFALLLAIFAGALEAQTLLSSPNVAGGGGSGTVTSVSGTTNEIDVATGTTTPVISAAAAMLNDTIAACSDAGATDTYACSTPVSIPYVTNGRYRFKANTANTGAATINFNSLGAKTIVKVAGGVTTALADNDIRVGQVVDLVYDGTNMQMQSTLGNAAGGASPAGSATELQARADASTFGAVIGSANTAALANPSAPGVVPTNGGDTSTSYGYKIRIFNGIGFTLPSAETTVMNAATLDGSHFNTITLPTVASTLCTVARSTGPSVGLILVNGISTPCDGSTVLDQTADPSQIQSLAEGGGAINTTAGVILGQAGISNAFGAGTPIHSLIPGGALFLTGAMGAGSGSGINLVANQQNINVVDLFGIAHSSAYLGAERDGTNYYIETDLFQTDEIGANRGVCTDASAFFTPCAGTSTDPIATTYRTTTNCADSAGAAACGSAAAGRFVADAAATSVVVSTTAVTANSEIFIEYDSSLSAALSVTCNATIPSAYAVTARTAGTSFTLTTTANVANPGCFSYHIVN